MPFVSQAKWLLNQNWCRQEDWTKKIAENIRNYSLHSVSDGAFAEGIGSAACMFFEKTECIIMA